MRCVKRVYLEGTDVVWPVSNLAAQVSGTTRISRDERGETWIGKEITQSGGGYFNFVDFILLTGEIRAYPRLSAANTYSRSAVALTSCRKN